MIATFKCSETQKIAEGESSAKFPPDIQTRARLKLRMLAAAINFNDLRQPPGNRLEILKDNRDGQHSIRINDQWRLCFVWRDGSAHDVEIVDYH